MTHVVLVAALVVSVAALAATGMLAWVLLSKAPSSGEKAFAAAVVAVGAAQVAAPAWLLWRVGQGGFDGWGLGLGVLCLVVSGLLAAGSLLGAGAAAQP